MLHSAPRLQSRACSALALALAALFAHQNARLPTYKFMAAAAAADGVCYTDCVNGFCPQGEISYTCTCENGHSGPDCSLRRCPTGKAWTFSTNVTDHDLRVECSNMGTCDATTGTCTCRTGFYGDACEHMGCSSACNGHGQCMTRQEFEYHNYRNLATTIKAGEDWVGELAFAYTEWDADMIEACVCDKGYEGFSCEEQSLCPKGDDPLTLGQADEVQILECTCGDGLCDTETFRLGFRREGISQHMEWSVDIAATAVASELEAALIGIPSLSGGVTIQVDGLAASTTDAICDAAGRSTGITMTHTPGQIAPLQPLTISGDLTFAIGVDGATSSFTALADTITAVTGEREYISCSGRGYCVDGEYCSCLDNFVSSSGAVGEEGGRADCGVFTEVTVTEDDCPQDTSGNICFGHGTCTGYANVCVCDPGYTGRQCQARQCEAGLSFFAYEDGSDHDESFTCSNRGSCDTDTGECVCMDGFEGDSCSTLTCDTVDSNECGDHGTCDTLAAIATNEGDVYASTWDSTQIKGCLCDTDVYVGPFTGEVSDYSGYLCDQLSCPTGDDPLSTDVVEEAECSNRGLCDRSTGHCSCFSGFCSSNGTGFAGTLGDCGFKSNDCDA